MMKIPDEPFRLRTRGQRPPSPPKRSWVKAVVWTLAIQSAVAATLACFHCGLGWEDLLITGPIHVEMVAPADEPDQEDSDEPEVVEEKTIPLLTLPPIQVTESQETWTVPQMEEVTIDVPTDIVQVDEPLQELEFGELFEKKQPESKVAETPRKPQKSPVKDKTQKKKVEIASNKGAEAKDDVPARYRNAPLPPYPSSARSQGKEGVVHLLVSIDAEGHPTSVALARSSGVESLDRAALQWVPRNWTFYPATRHGVAIASNIITPIRFELD
jgi:protein TonB